MITDNAYDLCPSLAIRLPLDGLRLPLDGLRLPLGGLHSKQNRFLTEHSKKVPEKSKGVQRLRKRVLTCTKPLKVHPVCPLEEPSPAKPIFKFRTVEKGFV